MRRKFALPGNHLHHLMICAAIGFLIAVALVTGIVYTVASIKDGI